MPSLREQRTVTVTAGSTQLLGPNMRRRGVIIGTPKVATIWISFVGAAVAGQGIPIRPGQTPFQLRDDSDEGVFTNEVNAISEGVAEQIGVVDLFG